MSQTKPAKFSATTAKSDAAQAASESQPLPAATPTSAADAVVSQSETTIKATAQGPTDSPADAPPASVDALAQAPLAPEKPIEQLQAELAAANAKIAELSAKRDDDDAVEIVVRQKMSVGLTRSQALAVIRRQKDWDNSPHGRMNAARNRAWQNAKSFATA